MSSDIRIVKRGIRDCVGESPVYDPRTQTLIWVDIIGRKVRVLDLVSGALMTYTTEVFPTAVGLCETQGQVVAACAHGVVLLDIETGETTPFATIPGEPDDNRLNEGAVGPDGAFWVGTMQTNLNDNGSMREMTRQSGAFYRVGPGQSVRRVTNQTFGISNTLAWDEVRGRMYLGDTLAQTLYVSEWPIAANGVPDWHVHARVTSDGFPDGSCIDTDGYIWNARYAGSCLLRISPTGQVDRKIDLPATNVTACCFGGPDYETLFVTTASNELSADAMRNEAEGALLAFEPGITGRAPYLFGL